MRSIMTSPGELIYNFTVRYLYIKSLINLTFGGTNNDDSTGFATDKCKRLITFNN
jgi:hypothetical protein